MTNTNDTNKEAEFSGSALNDGLDFLRDELEAIKRRIDTLEKAAKWDSAGMPSLLEDATP